MLSLRKNFLYIHIPKTGGNSVQLALKDYSSDYFYIVKGKHDGINNFCVRNRKYNTKKHTTLRVWHNKLSDEVFDELFKFTIVRNPWDRMISQFFWKQPLSKAERTWNRDGFIREIKRGKRISYFLKINENDDLLDNINFVLRFENLQQDFYELCDKLDLRKSELFHVNRSVHDDYKKYYDNELVDMVSSKFDEEIKIFGYEF